MGKDKEKKEKKDKNDKKRSRDDSIADSSPPPTDAKVSKHKKEKKDKKSKKASSPAVADALLDALAEKDVIVGKADDVDLMNVDLDTDGKVMGGTAADAKLLKDGEVVIGALAPFAKPLAEGKMSKKVLKTVKKAAKNKTLKRGVKEVVKSLRKSPLAKPSTPFDPNATPLLILAGDISPPDVISHLPVLAEDHGVPYIFVTSRAELGAAGATKRPTSVVMIMPPGSSKRKVSKKDGDDDKKALKKIAEEEEDFKTAYTDLSKEVHEITKKLQL